MEVGAKIETASKKLTRQTNFALQAAADVALEVGGELAMTIRSAALNGVVDGGRRTAVAVLGAVVARDGNQLRWAIWRMVKSRNCLKKANRGRLTSGVDGVG